jgi:hypothetical protein
MSPWRHERDIHVVTGTARKTRLDTTRTTGTACSRTRRSLQKSRTHVATYRLLGRAD